jgi:hypothetical protein
MRCSGLVLVCWVAVSPFCQRQCSSSNRANENFAGSPQRAQPRDSLPCRQPSLSPRGGGFSHLAAIKHRDVHRCPAADLS